MQIMQYLKSKTTRGVTRDNIHMQHFRNNQFCSCGSVVTAFPWCVHTGCAAAPSCKDTLPSLVPTATAPLQPRQWSSSGWGVTKTLQCIVHISISPEYDIFLNLNQCLEFLAIRLYSHSPQKLDLILHFLVAETPPLPKRQRELVYSQYGKINARAKFCRISTLVCGQSIGLFIFVKFIEHLEKSHYK